MKKKHLTIICVGVTIVLLVILIVAMIIKKIPMKSIEFEDFQQFTEEKGYKFIDNRERISVDQVGYSCAAFIREGVGVEFTECVSNQMAEQLYNNYKDYAQNFKANISKEASINFSKYGSYTMETIDTYMHITRINNTIMHVRVSPEDKETVIEFMKELDYIK